MISYIECRQSMRSMDNYASNSLPENVDLISLSSNRQSEATQPREEPGMDSGQFREAAKQLVEFIIDYHENIRQRPVLPSVEPHSLNRSFPDSAPDQPETWSKVFKDLDSFIMPGITHWQSPRFHAYFPAAHSYAATAADLLSSSLSCIGFSWIASPIYTELEMKMVDWLAKMLNLPEFFLFSTGGKGGGVIQSTASESTLITLLAARTKCQNDEKSANSIIEKLVAYASEESHSSVEKAGLLGSVKVRLLKTDVQMSLRGSSLKEAIDEDRSKGLIPFYVVATLGTTNSCAFDNLNELGVICQREGLWLHVDAAYAGSAFICSEYRNLLNGIEHADSFNLNAHKLVNFDCSVLWIKNRDYLTRAFNVNPVYLQYEQQEMIPDYRQLQIPLGRRFRSFKMWFVFRLYGVDGLREYIRRQIRLAHQFEDMLNSDKRFEICFPAVMGLVCFRMKGSNQLNEIFVRLINERRKTLISKRRS